MVKICPVTDLLLLSRFALGQMLVVLIFAGIRFCRDLEASLAVGAIG